jgi:hypothetical protein
MFSAIDSGQLMAKFDVLDDLDDLLKKWGNRNGNTYNKMGWWKKTAFAGN